MVGGREVSHLVEDVVGRQQALRLDEGDLAVAQQSGGVHRRLAGGRLRASHQPADYGNTLRLFGNPFGALKIALDEPMTLHQVARRIAADGEFREQTSSAPPSRARWA